MSSAYVSVTLSQMVFDRAQGACEYCKSQAKFAIDPLVIDHVYPVSLGGKTIGENLALACQTCKGQAKKYHPSHTGTIVMSHLGSSNAGCQKHWTGCKSSRETVIPLR